MNIVIRVDASHRIGSGHVYRCLSLADAFRARAAKVQFVHRMHPGHLGPTIRDRGYEVVELDAPERASDEVIIDGDYAAWLGVTEEQDAAETLAALGGKAAVDHVVVDHYSLGASWERTVRLSARSVAAIDDIAREHACDVLIDQNYFHDAERRYDGRVPDGARRLCGSRFALIADDYRAARAFLKPRRGPVSRVLVYYGGADLTGETARALRVLSEARFAHLAVDVLIGAAAPHRVEVERVAAGRARTTLHGTRRSIVDLMIEADLMVGAGGSTTWERCATGLPAIVTVMAENQRGFNEALAADGMIAYAGTTETVSDQRLAELLETLLASDEAPTRVATKAWDVTDGWGAHRVAEVIAPTPLAEWTLRRTDAISPATHRWIVTTPAGLPVAEAHLESQDGQTIVKRSVDAVAGGAGTARLLELISAECERTGLTASLALDRAKRADGLSLTILSDSGSWAKGLTPRLATEWLEAGHAVRLLSRANDLEPGELCFLLSVGQVLKADALAKHRHNLVVHAADLPKGRGWSPMTWQVLEGRSDIAVSLVEAGEKVDSGCIYDQVRFTLDGGELLEELQARVGDATVVLCTRFVRGYPASAVRSHEQVGEATYYSRRTPKDSAFDPMRPLAEQFDLLRVVDTERYPAYFRLRGRDYTLHVRERTKQTT